LRGQWRTLEVYLSNGRVTTVSSNGVVVLQNWYDAFGRRIAKQELGSKWLYLYSGWNIVGVMNGNGQLLESYTRGVGPAGDIGTLVAVSTNNYTYYIHNNHRGDVVLTRSGTTTVGSYSYSAFGILNSVSGSDVCRFKFSSKERDASTGFSYYGARFYAPQWQRWPNHDPIGERGGINLYQAFFNSPLMFVDRNGRDNIYAMGQGNNAPPAMTISGTPGGGSVGIQYHGGGFGDPLFGLGAMTAGPAWIVGGVAEGMLSTLLNALNLLKNQKPDPCKNKTFDPSNKVDQRDNDWHYHWDNNPHDSRGGQPHWDRGNLNDSSQQWSPDGDTWNDK
jgi:RHS repeat-associated protein